MDKVNRTLSSRVTLAPHNSSETLWRTPAEILALMALSILTGGAQAFSSSEQGPGVLGLLFPGWTWFPPTQDVQVGF